MQNKILRVFTRYDKIPLELMDFTIKPVAPFGINTTSEGRWDYVIYVALRTEDGLEGVKFVSYEVCQRGVQQPVIIEAGVDD